jgi:hypothetical protein
VDISDYDTAEQGTIQGYVDTAKKDIETAKTRKEVYEIVTDFISDVSKVQTANEKKLEEALRAAEEAKKQYNNNNNNTIGGNDQNTDQSLNTDNSNDTSGNYKSDELNTGNDTQEKEEDGGFLNSLIGGLAGGSNN